MKKIISSILLMLLGLMAMKAQEPQANYVLKTQETGDKTYVARDYVTLQTGFTYTASAGESFLAKIDQCLLFPPTDATYIKEDGSVTTDPTLGAVVGTISGSLNVNSSGAATYTIPIECPDGINGLKPNVSLVYNSQGGSGIAGWGWNISGLSMISRTPMNMYYDGSISKLIWDKSSPFSLDGNRLFPISTNGTTSIEYKPVNEMYAKIVGYDIQAWGPSYFKVFYKDGKIATYGTTDSSKYPLKPYGSGSSNMHLGWAVTKIEDRNGNHIEYEYTYEARVTTRQTNNSHRVSKIKYGANSVASSMHFAEVNFIYVDRNDVDVKYFDGETLQQKKRLSQISVKQEGTGFRTYTLNQLTDPVTILLSVSVSGDGEKLIPLQFNMTEQEATAGFNKTGTGYWSGHDKGYGSNVFGDFNGDGRTDIAGYSYSFGSSNRWTVCLSNGSGFTKSTWTGPLASLGSKFVVSDFNGDGLSDIAKFVGNSNWAIYFSTGSGFTAKTWAGHDGGINNNIVGDFNGDGRTDIAGHSGHDNWHMCLSNGNGFTRSNWNNGPNTEGDKCMVGDFNGDGLSDVAAFAGNGSWHVCLSNGNGFDGAYWSGHDGGMENNIYADFNGDGLTDIAGHAGDHSWHVCLSTGKGFASKIWQGHSGGRSNCFVGDFNGDGKADIAGQAADHSWHVCLSNGDGFDSDYWYGHNGGYDFKNAAVDYNGDGMSDIAGYAGGGNWHVTLSNCKRTVLESVENGLTTSLINYKSLSEPNSCYTKESDGIYPIIDMQGAIHVVSKVQGVADNTTFTNVNYSYKGAKVHRLGKGFLGFRVRKTTDLVHNSETETTNTLDNTYVSFKPYTSKTRIGGTLVKSSVSDVLLIGLGGKRLATILNYKKNDDLLNNTSVKKSYSSYDSYGNAQVIKTEYFNAGSLFDVSESKSISYVTKGSWCPNKPETVTSTQKNGSDTQSRTIRYEYDSKGNLSKKILDYAKVKERETHYSDYDNFGNAQTVTVKSEGKTRSTTLKYTDSGRFVSEKTNSFTGFKTSYTYDESRGLLSSERDYLGLTTDYEYGGFGRLIKTNYADGTYAVNVLQWKTSGNGPSNARYYSYLENSGSSPTWTWFDAMGRELRSEAYGLDSNKKIWVDKDYNAKGQVSSISKQYFAGSSKTPEVSYIYDTYGRVDNTISALGITNYTYAPLKTTVSTPSTTSVKELNSAGQLIKSRLNGRSVTYTYWASGLTKTATPQGGVAVETVFDLQGNRTKLIDPDAGTIESVYNGFGELLWEEHKKTENGTDVTIRNSFVYDDAGRVLTSTINGATTSSIYNPVSGFVESVTKGNHIISYEYDENGIANLGRVTSTTENLGNGKQFTFKTEYDAFGRESKRIYPSGYFTTNVYNQHGYLTQVKDKNGANIWKVVKTNARGQITETLKGNKTTGFGYDERGLPETIMASGVIDHNYHFNAKGNLEWREDFLTDQKEVFTYTEDNQLKSWEVKKLGTTMGRFAMTYDSHGNITSKSDLNYAMKYDDAQRLHAITSISGNPSVIADDVQDITYTDFKKVQTITEGTKALELSYGLDNYRRKAVFKEDGTTTLTRYYLGDYEENDYITGNDRKVHYISGGDGLAAIYIESNGTGQLYYAYTDYLGSLTALTNADGSIATLNGNEQRFAFDPWGNRREVDNWQNKLTSSSNLLVDRGFTMHEHYDGFALINMNGRVYDPLIARFLSPDPQLQSPGNWLNYNRYAYCFNNPLIYTDPSGEIVWFVPVIIGAAIGAYSGAAIAEGNANPTKWAWDKGTWSGMAIGGTIGALSGGAAAGISALGGSAALAGAGAGAVSGAGFNGMATDWDAGAMLKGAAIGAAAGFVGGSIATGIGGPGGAFAGGFSANTTSQLLSTGEVDFGKAMLAGGISFGMYHGFQYAQWKWGGGDNVGGIDISYKQFSKINTMYQRSQSWLGSKKENGLVLNIGRKGKNWGDMVDRADRYHDHVDFRNASGRQILVHSHVNNKMTYAFPSHSNGTPNSDVYSLRGYHSLVVSPKGSSTMMGYQTTPNVLIQSSPYVRFFLFPWLQ